MRTCLLVLATFVSLIVAAPARAGTYDVYSCRLPDGSPAPTTGWAPFASEPGATATDSCAAGGGLVALLPQAAAIGMEAGWAFTPPADATIEAFQVLRAVRPVSSWSAAVGGYVASLDSWPPAELRNGGDEKCLTGLGPTVAPCREGLGTSASPVDPANVYERYGLRAGRLTLGLGCWNPFSDNPQTCDDPAFPSDDPSFTVFAAKMTLRDDSAPSFDTDTLGAQLGAAAIRGVAHAEISAVDRGAGLAETSLVIDGVELDRGPVDARPASCHQPFTEPVPCPLHARLSMTFDSRAVADGVHTVQVAVFDAAGNRSLSAPVAVLVANAAGAPVPGPNGRGATRFVRLRAWLAGRSRKTDRTLAYGAATSVEGQLTTSNGAPVGGATLQVEQRVIGVSSRATPLATVTTNSTGRFTYRVARGASRSLRFTYTAFPGDAGPVASAQVSVHVRAGVSLRASPARVRNGSILRFRGRVLGERGTHRAVVTIYALTSGPRPRIPVETFRAAASGKFTYRYRFRSIPGPVTYRFEARVLKQAGFPYVEGASKPVAVRGRP